MARNRIRVLLVDDHRVFREGLRELLNHRPDMEVVAEAGTGAEALEKMSAEPDVVVLDIKLPDTDGVAVCSQILAAHPGSRVIMLTMYGDDDYLFQAIKAGALGFVLKDADSEQVVSTIRNVAKGQSELDPASTAKLLQEYRRLSREKLIEERGRLTQRELEMLALIAAGKTNREIAARLSLSEQTVKNNLSILYQKLQVRNRAEAVVAIMQQGIRLPDLNGSA